LKIQNEKFKTTIQNFKLLLEVSNKEKFVAPKKALARDKLECSPLGEPNKESLSFDIFRPS